MVSILLYSAHERKRDIIKGNVVIRRQKISGREADALPKTKELNIRELNEMIKREKIE
jgi:hypothetical protein